MASSAKTSRRGSKKAAAGGTLRDSTPLEVGEVATLNLASINTFLQEWLTRYSGSGGNAYSRARKLAEGHSYAQSITNLKNSFFNAGLLITGIDADKTTRSERLLLNRLVRDTWVEFLSCDNVVAVWTKAAGNERPVVSILNCEQVKYKNQFGIEELKVQLPTGMSEEQKKALPPRYREALEQKSGWLTLDANEGEHFQVLTRAKLGHGLSLPRMKAVFEDLAIWDFFRMGDWNGASERRKILRQAKKGHAVTSGDGAGSARHFLKDKFAKKLREKLAGLLGAGDIVTNFDVEFAYTHLKAEYFDPKIASSTIERLDNWAGPIAKMLRGSEGNGSLSPYLMELFEAEAMAARDLVKEFVESILGHPTIGHSGAKVTFDDTLFLPHKFRHTFINQAYGAGLMSAQTARRKLRLDNAEESRLQKEAHADRLAFTPPFEAKQGMGLNVGKDEGGRPTNVEE